MKTATRPLRVHMAMLDGPISQFLIDTMGTNVNLNVDLVPTAEKADLVLFYDVSEIEKDLKQEKFYGYLPLDTCEPNPQLPANVRTIDGFSPVAIASLIADVSQTLSAETSSNDANRASYKKDF